MTSPEIYSLLVPLASGRLLVPRTCVAEITGFVQPAAMPGAPPWYLGVIPWNGRQVPLVSFEGICGEPIPDVTTRSRVLLLHVLGPRLDTGCYGIVSQGFPQLMRVGPEVIRPDPGYVAPAHLVTKDNIQYDGGPNNVYDLSLIHISEPTRPY